MSTSPETIAAAMRLADTLYKDGCAEAWDAVQLLAPPEKGAGLYALEVLASRVRELEAERDQLRAEAARNAEHAETVRLIEEHDLFGTYRDMYRSIWFTKALGEDALVIGTGPTLAAAVRDCAAKIGGAS